MSELKKRFNHLCGAGLDISEHLGLLHGLSLDPSVETIVELGFREGVSATALALSGKPLTCYDIEKCAGPAAKLKGLAPNFTFHQGDSLRVEIPKCDLLHIDTLHTYKQLRQELSIHSPLCRRWIAIHDTEAFKIQGKDGSRPGLFKAITDFLFIGEPKWQVLLRLRNNNGMTILERIK